MAVRHGMAAFMHITDTDPPREFVQSTRPVAWTAWGQHGHVSDACRSQLAPRSATLSTAGAPSCVARPTIDASTYGA